MTFHELNCAGGEQHRSQRVVAAPGDQIVMTVEEIPSSGYRVDQFPVSVSVAPDSAETEGLLAGGARTPRLAFSVHGHRLGPLDLSLRRPFGDNTPARTVTVDLIGGS
jgi:hypothetical protein